MEIIFAALAVFVAYLTWHSQKKHNRVSVMPIPELKYSDMMETTSVSLTNAGTGPLRIIRFRVLIDGVERFDSLMDATHLRSAQWFVSNIDGRAIAPNGRISLLRFRVDHFDKSQSIHQLRRELGVCEVEVKYTDVYGTDFEPYRRSLKWFARHNEPLATIDSNVTD